MKKTRHFLGFAISDGGHKTNVSRHIIADSYGAAWDAFKVHCAWQGWNPMMVVEHPTGLPE